MKSGLAAPAEREHRDAFTCSPHCTCAAPDDGQTVWLSVCENTLMFSKDFHETFKHSCATRAAFRHLEKMFFGQFPHTYSEIIKMSRHGFLFILR